MPKKKARKKQTKSRYSPKPRRSRKRILAGDGRSGKPSIPSGGGPGLARKRRK